MDSGPVPPPSYPAPPDQQQQQQQQADQQQQQQQPPQQQEQQQRSPQQTPKPHTTSTPSYPPPPQSSPPPPPPQHKFPGDPRTERNPTATTSTSTPVFAGAGIETLKSACEVSLGGYVELQRQQQRRRQERQYRSQYPNQYADEDEDPKAQDRLRYQGGVVVSDLRALRAEVSALVRAAEARRWRRWLLGGLVASFIPIIRKIFRRPAPAVQQHHHHHHHHHDDRRARAREPTSTSTFTFAQATTDTEHAFHRSRSLVSRILEHMTSGSGNGNGDRLASAAFFVLGVLYAFQNEVSLRVGRTVKRRLKRLTNKIERGEGDVVDEDLDVLRGWRWRVLLM